MKIIIDLKTVRWNLQKYLPLKPNVNLKTGQTVWMTTFRLGVFKAHY